MKADQVIKHLFVSQTRQKLIQHFFYNPSEMYYVRQLVRLCDEEINSVRRELSNLVKADIIIAENRGNRLYYTVNKQNNLYHQLLTLAHQISGLGRDLQSSKVGNIKLLVYSNSFLSGLPPRQADSIDMLIVGDVSIREVDEAVRHEETKLGREINYMVMDKNELKLRKQKRDPVIIDFFINCPTSLIGIPIDFETV